LEFEIYLRFGAWDLGFQILGIFYSKLRLRYLAAIAFARLP
jgi:hypothetical protein